MEKATIFDKIGASSPLDATAGRVTARGEHWVPDAQMPPGWQHWKSPPVITAFVPNHHEKVSDDLTGKKVGRFTIVGVLGEKGGKNAGRRWVCKCVCGDYEARSAKALRAAVAGIVDTSTVSYRCFYCAQWEIAKNRYKKKGAKPLSDFTRPKTKESPPKRPEQVVADALPAAVDDAGRLAIAIIAALNSAGYRVVKHRPLPDATEAQVTEMERKWSGNEARAD